MSFTTSKSPGSLLPSGTCTHFSCGQIQSGATQEKGLLGNAVLAPVDGTAPLVGGGESVLKFCLAHVDVFFSGAWAFMRVMLVGCKYDSGPLPAANCPCAIRP